MFYSRNPEAPILDNLRRVYGRAPSGAPRAQGPDFDALLHRLHEKWAAPATDAGAEPSGPPASGPPLR